MATYTIERVVEPEDFTQDIVEFIEKEVLKLNNRFDNKLNFKNTPYYLLAKKGYIWIGRRDGEVRGWMIAASSPSILDPSTKVFKQITLYVKPDSGRMAYHLFQKFIDIGKREANHIITMLTSQTNIKPSTLQRYGFEELETLYRLEV